MTGRSVNNVLLSGNIGEELPQWIQARGHHCSLSLWTNKTSILSGSYGLQPLGIVEAVDADLDKSRHSVEVIESDAEWSGEERGEGRGERGKPFGGPILRFPNIHRVQCYLRHELSTRVRTVIGKQGALNCNIYYSKLLRFATALVYYTSDQGWTWKLCTDNEEQHQLWNPRILICQPSAVADRYCIVNAIYLVSGDEWQEHPSWWTGFIDLMKLGRTWTVSFALVLFP